MHMFPPPVAMRSQDYLRRAQDAREDSVRTFWAVKNEMGRRVCQVLRDGSEATRHFLPLSGSICRFRTKRLASWPEVIVHDSGLIGGGRFDESGAAGTRPLEQKDEIFDHRQMLEHLLDGCQCRAWAGAGAY